MFDFIGKVSADNRIFFSDAIKLEKDFEILNENDSCSHVLFIVSGEVEVYKISENGKKFRLYNINAGETCVLNLSCVLSDNKYMAFARASTDVVCYLIPNDEFLRMFNEEESIRTYVFNQISSRFIQVTSKVENIVLDTVESRLRNWIHEQDKDVIYTTHDEIASNLGTAREVVSRQLKKWEKDGKIIVGRGRIELINL